MSQIPVPLTREHLQWRDTFAWPDRCPYKTGSTVSENSVHCCLICVSEYIVITANLFL